MDKISSIFYSGVSSFPEKGWFLLFSILAITACEKERVSSMEQCATCSAHILINGNAWLSKPRYAWFQPVEPLDTFFTLEVNESNPTHDIYQDALLFWRLPYQPGVYPLDANLPAAWGTNATLIVYEGGYDSPTTIYSPVFDGSSRITVDSLNKSTGMFWINFQLVLYPNGDPSAEARNTTFPAILTMEGHVLGTVTDE